MPASNIQKARILLEEAGLIKSVVPADLVRASRELKKPLREALDAIMAAIAEAEGSVS